MAVTAAGRFAEADLLDVMDVTEPDAAMSDVTARDLRRLVGQRVLNGEDRKRDHLAATVAARTLYDAGLTDVAPELPSPAQAAKGRNPVRDDVMRIVDEMRRAAPEPM